MKIARISPASMSTTNAVNNGISPTPEFESTMDAYAKRVLEIHSPSEACIDTNLGPYVTALLRCAEQEKKDKIKNTAVFESLVELVQDHCAMRYRQDAESALKTILEAIQTGVVPFESRTIHRRVDIDFPSTISALPNYANFFETSLPNNPSDWKDPSNIFVENPQPFSSELSGEDLKFDFEDLIPLDLLVVLDDPVSPEESLLEQKALSDFNTAKQQALQEQKILSDSDKKKQQQLIEESREDALRVESSNVILGPNSNIYEEILDEDADSNSSNDKKLRFGAPTFSNTVDISTATRSVSPDKDRRTHLQQLEWCSEVLCSLNSTISEGAVRAAASMADMDANVAQYLIDSALSAPPICRNLMNDGCYRSDCHFSHHVEGHTCAFWLRGRCGKKEFCRFLHGFNENLLEGANQCTSVNNEFRHLNSNSSSDQVVDQVAVEVQSSSHSRATRSLSSRNETNSKKPVRKVSSSKKELLTNSGSPPAFSFASVASKGYNQQCFQPVTTKFVTLAPLENRTVLPSSNTADLIIPKDVWNPYDKRDPSAFHIADPMERYTEVSANMHRKDVIDLHFQSTKTFHSVLRNLLEPKMREYGSVWIVTGTGHQIGTKSQQHKGGGVLENAVVDWLHREGVEFCRGRDRDGHSGALLVNR